MIASLIKWTRLLWVVALCWTNLAPSPLLAQPVTHTSFFWEPLNHGLPPDFAVTALAADPNTPTHLFATLYLSTGLLESLDQGRSWQPVALTNAPHLPLTTLLFNPHQPDQLLLGGPDGLFTLTLGENPVGATGAYTATHTVTAVADWPVDRAVFALAASADSTLYAATATRYGEDPLLWSSRDGARWQPSLPLPAPASAGTALLSVLSTPQGLFVGTAGAGLFVQRPGTNGWQPITTIGETYVAALWAAPWDGQLLLARTRAGLYRSRDGGQSWAVIAIPSDARIDSITAFAGQTILLGLGDGSLLRSFDQGRSWQRWGSSLGRDGLFAALTVIPTTTVNLLAGTQHGLYRSIDSGLTWQAVTLLNPPLTFFPAQALAQNQAGELYLGAADGVYASQNQGGGWRWASIALPRKAVLALGFGGDGGETLFAGSEAGIFRLNAGGAHWQALNWRGSVPGLALAPQAPNRLYLRAAYERIYTTDDAQSNAPEAVAWTQRGSGMPLTTELLSLAIDPTDPQILYAGAATELFKSTDGANHWRPIGAALAGQSIFALLVDRQASQRLYAGATNGLYQSQDGGATWRELGAELRAITVSALAQHPTGDLLAVGTKFRGLWLSVDRGVSWSPAELPTTATVHNLLFSTDGQWLFAATDHGFWRTRVEGK